MWLNEKNNFINNFWKKYFCNFYSEIVKNFLFNFNKNLNFNLIIYGNNGVGKTFFVNYLFYTVLKNYSDNIYHIDFLDIKNIEKYLNELNIFCKKKNNNNNKFIIIDNVDFLTFKYQNTIYNNICKYDNIYYVIISNKLLNITNTIQTNAIILKIKCYDITQISNNVLLYCNENNINISIDYIENLIKLNNYDLRFTLNNLWTLKNMKINTNFNFWNFIFLNKWFDLYDLINLIINNKLKQWILLSDRIYKKGINFIDLSMFLINILTWFEKNNINYDFYKSKIIIEKKKIYIYIKILYKYFVNNNNIYDNKINFYNTLGKLCFIKKD